MMTTVSQQEFPLPVSKNVEHQSLKQYQKVLSEHGDSLQTYYCTRAIRRRFEQHVKHGFLSFLNIFQL